MYLRAEALNAFLAMAQAARKDGAELRIVSSYRSGSYQEGLYERAVRRDGLSQRYSAPPGHSEHQLGTTVDLSDARGTSVLEEGFARTFESRWLEQNAERFGFRRSYRDDTVARTGYVTEPWHWRYHGAVAAGK